MLRCESARVLPRPEIRGDRLGLEKCYPCLIADAETNADNVLLLKGCDAGIARLPQSTVTYRPRNVNYRELAGGFASPEAPAVAAPVVI